MKENVAKLAMAGFARIHLKEDGELVGDSGWLKNAITDFGLDESLAQTLMGLAGSKPVAAVALGSGVAPNSTTASLPAVIQDVTNARDVPGSVTVTHASAQGVTCRWAGTFASGDNHFSTSHNISNIGLYDATVTTGGSVIAGATYTGSVLDTNQDVEYTYEWRFATTE